MTPPTINDAEKIGRQVLGEPIASVQRFGTGYGNWVYDVATAGGRRAVVRIARRDEECAAGVEWSKRLRELGVRLPRMLGYHLAGASTAGAGERSWMVLERLPGTDLGHALPGMTRPQQLAVLGEVMRAQAIVRALPPGDGYGFTEELGRPPHARWRDVLVEHQEVTRRRIEGVGATSAAPLDRLLREVERDDFADVEPLAFLDDTTNWNVIVHEGVFQGIVDVDSICYGDDLFVVALTRMALLHHGPDTFYTDTWAERLALHARRRRRLNLYTAMFAANFLGEIGQQFNREAAPAIDRAEVRRLASTLHMLLRAL